GEDRKEDRKKVAVVYPAVELPCQEEQTAQEVLPRKPFEKLIQKIPGQRNRSPIVKLDMPHLRYGSLREREYVCAQKHGGPVEAELRKHPHRRGVIQQKTGKGPDLKRCLTVKA